MRSAGYVDWHRAMKIYYEVRSRPQQELKSGSVLSCSGRTFLRAACAARRARGTRNGEQETYLRPRSWQNSTDARLPPCSPQMPILISGLTEQARSTPIFIRSPTPRTSSVSNGFASNTRSPM